MPDPGVLGNDTDPNGLALHTVLGADVTNGTLTLNSDGSFDYTPDAGYTGADSFTYQACTPAPGSVCSSVVTVDLTIGNGTPVALDNSYSVAQNATLSVAVPGVLGNDTDPNGDTLTAAVVTGVSNGTLTLNPDGSFVYTPNTGYIGADSFTYQACDTQSACDGATVSLTVTQTAPGRHRRRVQRPQERDPDRFQGPGVLGNDTDPNGLALHTVLDAGASHGTLTLNPDGSFVYTPTTGYTGADSFTYQACTLASVCSSVVTVDLTIGNDGPDAVDDSYSVAENGSLTVAAPGVLGNDTDPNGDTLTAAGVLMVPNNGTLTLNPDGSFVYTPYAGFYGTDSFTYEACDTQSACDGAIVSLTVTQIPPVALDDSYSVAENGTLTVAGPGVLGNDSDPSSEPLSPLLIGTGVVQRHAHPQLRRLVHLHPHDRLLRS